MYLKYICQKIDCATYNFFPVLATTVLNNDNVKYGDANCASDYLLIAGGSETGSAADLIHSKDRFCGFALGHCKAGTGDQCSAQIGAVTTFTKPFIVSDVLM